VNLRPAAALAVLLVASTGLALAQQVTVDVNRISDSGIGEKVGTVTVSEGKGGVSFKISVKGLPPAQRGFHVHEKGDCGPAMKDGKMTAGIAAREHYDLKGTSRIRDQGEKATRAICHSSRAPGLESSRPLWRHGSNSSMSKVALSCHEGDNYSDTPENGGGKGRVACGRRPTINIR
jgi:superoxide dismutase, Cu-Zn family